eukprot:scaffold270832_cov35-Tisochrysis_lutea.AAC.2
MTRIYRAEELELYTSPSLAWVVQNRAERCGSQSQVDGQPHHHSRLLSCRRMRRRLRFHPQARELPVTPAQNVPSAWAAPHGRSQNTSLPRAPDASQSPFRQRATGA